VSDLDVHLTAIASGDADAFARWLAGSEARVRLSLSSFAAQVDVEAVVQETMLRVWQVAPRFQADGAPNALLRFAIRAARNAAISEARRLRTARRDAEEEAAPPAEPIEPDPLLRARILECREALPAKPAQALSARLETAGADADPTLAARLGMTLNTFLQNVTRARKLLLECLEKKGIALPEVAP
jgi:RNA polymerase sigma factor (sigma-70 family)